MGSDWTPDIERLARIIGRAETEMPPEYMDELIQHPASNSWDEPTMPRWHQWTDTAEAVAEDLLSERNRLREALEEIYKFELARHPLDTLSEHRGSVIWRMKEICRAALKSDVAREALGAKQP